MAECPFCGSGVTEDLISFGGTCPKCFAEIPGEEAPTDPGEEVKAIQERSDRRRATLRAAIGLASMMMVVSCTGLTALTVVLWPEPQVVELVDFDEIDIELTTSPDAFVVSGNVSGRRGSGGGIGGGGRGAAGGVDGASGGAGGGGYDGGGAGGYDGGGGAGGYDGGGNGGNGGGGAGSNGGSIARSSGGTAGGTAGGGGGAGSGASGGGSTTGLTGGTTGSTLSGGSPTERTVGGRDPRVASAGSSSGGSTAGTAAGGGGAASTGGSESSAAAALAERFAPTGGGPSGTGVGSLGGEDGTATAGLGPRGTDLELDGPRGVDAPGSTSRAGLGGLSIDTRNVTRDDTLVYTDRDGIIMMIGEKMVQQIPLLNTCYERQLKANPTLEGRWRLDFTVTPGGTVERASATGLNRRDQELETCIVDLMESRWKFAKINEPYPVRRTLTFRPG